MERLALADTRRRASATATARDGLRRGHARRRRAGRRSRAAGGGSASRRASRSGSRWPPASAEAAPTPRRRSGSRNALPRRAARAERAPRARGEPRRGRAVLPRQRPPARRPATARRSSRSTLPPRLRRLLAAPERGQRRPSTADVYAALRRAPTATRATTERRAALSRRSQDLSAAADLAALPPNDLASSPLAAELAAAGALRADVTGAGPVVYGLFASEAEASVAADAVGANSAHVDHGTRLIPSSHAERPTDRARRDTSRAARSPEPRQGRAGDRRARGHPRPRGCDPVVVRRLARARRAGDLRGVGA